jgi:hypothetical protein
MAGSVDVVAFPARPVAVSSVLSSPPPLVRGRSDPSGGRDHPDQHRRARCHHPLVGLLADRRREDARRSIRLLLSFFVVSPRQPLTLERRPPPPRRMRLLLRVSKPQQRSTSTLTTLASRGNHLHGVHTGLYSSHNVHTLTTLRLRGVSARWLLPSALLQYHRLWCPL